MLTILEVLDEKMCPPHMAEPESLAVENHHDSGHLSSLFLDDQLEEGEDTGEEVEERHLGNIRAFGQPQRKHWEMSGNNWDKMRKF